MRSVMFLKKSEIMENILKRSLVVLVTTLACFWQAQAFAKWPTLLTLYAGESKVVDATGVKRISIGNSKLVSSTMLENGEIVLIGEAAGETNLLAWYKDGSRKTLPIVVVESNGWRESLEVKELLGDIEGVKITTIGRRIVVDGLLDTSDLERVKLLKERYSDMLILAREINSFEQPMLHFDVRITEISRDVTEELGISWSKTFAGPTLGYENVWGGDNLSLIADNENTSNPVGTVIGAAINPVTLLGVVAPDIENGEATLAQQQMMQRMQRESYTYWGIGTSVLSMINVLESNGAAMTLTNPRLSSRSGGQASLSVGGSVPVITSSVSGQSVEYKDYGVLLSVEPTLDRYNNITAKIKIEVSALDLANAVNGQPAFRKRSSDSDIKLQPGETLALAGLIQQEEQLAYSGIKWLSDIPLLGNLFRNKSFTDGKTELVILITPTEVVDPEAGENGKLIDRSKEILQEFSTLKESLVR